MRTKSVMLMATLGFVAVGGLHGQTGAQTPLFKRTVLPRGDLVAPGREAVMALAEFSPDGATGKHTHPGEEISYDRQILIQIERDWDAAFLRKDIGFIEKVLAEEFIATYGDGSRGDRARELKLAAEFNQQIDSSAVDEFAVKVYGDTAVVWFTQQRTGPSQGRPLTVIYRYQDVFVLRAGRWQCVASQSTKVTA